ncbi:LysR substrate-binding domain-containing protein [Hoeflea sp. G2-23]|uniref:LysR substrate-binding domain-containing protein n=1 Tax=Hoeflea algicola TaxID=2983763 RepID=A0ABT3Z4J2_9HYPH|nr:LysR substrate-binding domain-containing protein [Hoeflea algicola]MCY0146226.1 LysR substrate-binding domain-containing protein [Hoeflea algicola]
MRFKHYDNLRTFSLVARHDSFASAADELHLTKGAISHQMRQLENELGFAVFRRLPRGIVLTQRGQELLAASQSAFEAVEQQIDDLRRRQTRALTIGVTTYFASRWLSPRLMEFMQLHPDIRLRIQPMIDLADLRGEGVDLAIRWGDGAWKDVVIEPLFACPSWPSGNRAALKAVEDHGFEAAFESFTLLHDRDDSQAWPNWFSVAGLAFKKRTDTLIIPDPNVRVQAVIDGQGVALNDALVGSELASGALYRLSPIELSDYGYFLAYGVRGETNPDIEVFATWLKSCS